MSLTAWRLHQLVDLPLSAQPARIQERIFHPGGERCRLIWGKYINCQAFFRGLTYSSLRWIYSLYLAMDANFRLKLRDRGVKNDRELGPGWAYFVDDKHYQSIMSTFGDQKEVWLRLKCNNYEADHCF